MRLTLYLADDRNERNITDPEYRRYRKPPLPPAHRLLDKFINSCRDSQSRRTSADVPRDKELVPRCSSRSNWRLNFIVKYSKRREGKRERGESEALRAPSVRLKRERTTGWASGPALCSRRRTSRRFPAPQGLCITLAARVGVSDRAPRPGACADRYDPYGTHQPCPISPKLTVRAHNRTGSSPLARSHPRRR